MNGIPSGKLMLQNAGIHANQGVFAYAVLFCVGFHLYANEWRRLKGPLTCAECVNANPGCA